MVEQSQEEIIVPHPSSYTNVQKEPVTPWQDTDDGEVLMQGNRPLPHKAVRCRVVEEVIYDDYNMELKRTPVIEHQSYDQKTKKWSSDIAVTMMKPDMFMDHAREGQVLHPGIRTRFGSTVRMYEEILVKRGKELPICLLGTEVYPQTLNTAFSMGFRTIEDFAFANKKRTEELREKLRQLKFDRQASLLDEFQARAKGHLEDLGITKKGASPAAA